MSGLPQKFIDFISQHPQLQGLDNALLNEPPSVSVRLNMAKNPQMPAGANTVPWAADCGYYIDGDRPQFTFDPALHQGLYYVQDASSMAISTVIKQLAANFSTPILYLDACAAPGGKTTCAIDALPHDAAVVANEYDFARAEILAENVMKWGSPRVFVSRGDTRAFRKLTNTFHIIAADVPCSGEGMMRKDAKAVQQWSPALIEQCAQRQREILDNLWPALMPGGYMIYSTCTFNLEENEHMVQYLIDNYEAESVGVEALDSIDCITKGISTNAHCYRFIPGHTRGEGLFIAVLRKSGSPSSPKFKPAKLKPSKSPGTELAENLKGDYCVGLYNSDRVYALPTDLMPLATTLEQNLNLIHRGVQLATVKGRDAVPHQSLALSTALKPDAFARAEVGRDTAIDFLRRQAITLPDGTPRGFVLLTYNDLPLGFVKNLGNRANNLYPDHWKILKAPR